MREFSFVSRAQDRRRGAGIACLDGSDGHAWSERGAAMLSEGGRAQDSLRCLQLAVRLGCRASFIYQDMAVARLAMMDLGGALSDVRQALQLAGCVPEANMLSNSQRCESPEILLNYASLLDKTYPSHRTLHKILDVLHSYVVAACRKDASGALSCAARGAIPAIVERWRLGQLSFNNWDTWQEDKWLLTAAVEADVERCRADEAGLRYSVVQPWEVRNSRLVVMWLIGETRCCRRYRSGIRYRPRYLMPQQRFSPRVLGTMGYGCISSSMSPRLFLFSHSILILGSFIADFSKSVSSMLVL